MGFSKEQDAYVRDLARPIIDETLREHEKHCPIHVEIAMLRAEIEANRLQIKGVISLLSAAAAIIGSIATIIARRFLGV